MIDTTSLWDHEAMVKRQAMLPPWSPEQRQIAWRELAMYGDHALTTILREERITRADNIAHYCRKCRGLGTKRHHAMCPKRGCCTPPKLSNPIRAMSRILERSLRRSPMQFVHTEGSR